MTKKMDDYIRLVLPAEQGARFRAACDAKMYKYSDVLRACITAWLNAGAPPLPFDVQPTYGLDPKKLVDGLE